MVMILISMTHNNPTSEDNNKTNENRKNKYVFINEIEKNLKIEVNSQP